MTTTTTPKKTTIRPAKATQKGSTARAALPLEWDAVEYVPRIRWWAFVAITWLAIPLASLLLIYGNWSAAILVLVIAVAILVIYIPRPKTWHYRLKGSTIAAVREHRRGAADEIHLDLQDYRAFTTKVMRTRARVGGVEHFVLRPKARLGRARDVYLPAELEAQQEVGDRLAAFVPFQETT